MKKSRAYVEDVLVAAEENVVKPQRSWRGHRPQPKKLDTDLRGFTLFLKEMAG
jgi:hypothetical protein